MTSQQIRNYGIILLSLITLILILDRPFGGDQNRTQGEAIFPDFDPGVIDRMVVDNKGAVIELERRSPNDWRLVADFELPADTSFIRPALQSVKEFSTINLVARNPEKHGIFEVDSTGARVDLFASAPEPVASFILGKTSRTGGGTYYRLLDDDAVYMTNTPVKTYFVKGGNAWRDRRIFALDAEWSKLVVERGDSTIVFEADAEQNWRLTSPEEFPVKRDDMDRILRNLARMFANAIVDSAIADEITGLDDPTVRVRAEQLDGEAIELLIGKQNENGIYYCKPADRDWVYMIAKYRVDPYYKDLYELRVETAPPDTTAGAVSDES